MMKLILGLAMALTLGACSTTRLSDAETLALYKAHAGEPVRDFQYFGQINGWTPLGDSALAVWTRPSQAYLLELYGPCADLDYAPAISLSNMMSRVSARFDNVDRAWRRHWLHAHPMPDRDNPPAGREGTEAGAEEPARGEAGRA